MDGDLFNDKPDKQEWSCFVTYWNGKQFLLKNQFMKTERCKNVPRSKYLDYYIVIGT